MKRASTLVSIILLISFHAGAQAPKRAEEYNNRGLERQAKGDLDGAIDDYGKAIELKPSRSTLAIVYNNRANARMAKNDFDGAISDYGKAIELEPDNPDHHYNRGISRLTKGDNQGSITDFSKVVELSPAFALAYNHRGNARRAIGDVEGAIADYTKAIEHSPRYAEAFYNRGAARQARNDFDGAIGDYTKAIELAPQFSDAFVNRGLARQSKKDLERAIADFSEALKIKPDDAGTYFARATARQEARQFDHAVADYSKVIELDPSNAQAFANRAVIEMLQGNKPQAEHDFDQAFKLDPNLKPQFNEFMAGHGIKPDRFEQAASRPKVEEQSNTVLEPVGVKKDLYPANADAKKEIEAALSQATIGNKRVMLVFGGNWCYDCHVLDQALHEGEAGKIVKESFLIVHVDIGEGEKNLDLVKKYETTLNKGVPTIVLLDATGRVIYSSTQGEFEAARQMMKKDLVAFLNRWKVPRE